MAHIHISNCVPQFIHQHTEEYKVSLYVPRLNQISEEHNDLCLSSEQEVEEQKGGRAPPPPPPGGPLYFFTGPDPRGI
jgi:hypothetical protein